LGTEEEEMKTVDFKEFRSLPFGTIFRELWKNETPGEWLIKGSTGDDDIALHSASLIDISSTGWHVPGGDKDFFHNPWFGRSTGCFEDKDTFEILEETEVDYVIATLVECHRVRRANLDGGQLNFIRFPEKYPDHGQRP
jgi:hypothetical protein